MTLFLRAKQPVVANVGQSLAGIAARGQAWHLVVDERLAFGCGYPSSQPVGVPV